MWWCARMISDDSSDLNQMFIVSLSLSLPFFVILCLPFRFFLNRISFCYAAPHLSLFCCKWLDSSLHFIFSHQFFSHRISFVCSFFFPQKPASFSSSSSFSLWFFFFSSTSVLSSDFYLMCHLFSFSLFHSFKPNQKEERKRGNQKGTRWCEMMLQSEKHRLSLSLFLYFSSPLLFISFRSKGWFIVWKGDQKRRRSQPVISSLHHPTPFLSLDSHHVITDRRGPSPDNDDDGFDYPKISTSSPEEKILVLLKQ